MTTDATIQPPSHISPLPPVSSLSWFASVSLLDGWGYGFSFSFLSSSCLRLQWCTLTVACVEAVHAVSHPQLSVSLSLTLNHCTVLCEKGEREKCNLPSAGSRGAISNSLFFTFYHTHWATCLCVSQCCHMLLQCPVLSQEGREFSSRDEGTF